MNYYGWVPILSGNIFLGFHNQKKRDEIILADYIEPKCCVRNYYSHPQDPKRLSKIEIGIPEQCIVSVNIEEICINGLIKFNFDTKLETEKPIVRKIILQIAYNSIKDFYHLHIHHSHDDDYIQTPVIAANMEEAVEKILEQYKKKIVKYHMQISKAIEKTVIKNKFGGLLRFILRDILHLSNYIWAIQQINIAIGEFTYAISFIRCCIDDERRKKEEVEIFFNAGNSLKVIREKIAWRLGFYVAVIALGISLFDVKLLIIKIWGTMQHLLINLFIKILT